ncbi:restriction system modified-DNA reader domain-containing protein [Cellulomonas soli]
MPIFELDEGKVRLVQPMQPLAGSFAQECAALLAGHLAAIAGEPLFTVRSRASVPEHTDAPDLLALDASGRPVVFDVAQVIDDDALVTAMRRAGQAGRMTVTDLARAYHVDPGRFGIDYAAFREQVSSGPQTSRREGVRLVLLCSEVAAEASDSLAFLRGPGRHVEVFQVGVVRGVDDRRLVDVSPLAVHEGVRRTVEPTALRLVRSSEAFASAMAYHPDDMRTPGGSGVGRRPSPPTGELRAVGPAERPPVPQPTPLSRRNGHTPTDQSEPTEPTEQTGAGDEPDRQTPAPAGLRTLVPADVSAVPAAGMLTGPTAALRASMVTPTASGQGTGGATPWRSLRHDDTLTDWGPLTDPSLQVPDPALTTLAKSRRALTTLVWLRERRGQRLQALLRADGLIELEDGSVYADPGEAAAAASGSESTVDGWRAWRLGDGGPTLAEATGVPTP